MITVQAIKVPEALILRPATFIRAVRRGLDSAAKGVHTDLKVVTKTWEHQVTFATSSPNQFERVVGTDDRIFKFVDGGTEPHVIRPKNGRMLTWIGTNYRAKTVPGQIRSRKGGNDNTVAWARQVQHPGTEAREFTKVVADKWNKQLAAIVQREIDGVLGKGGRG